MNEHDENENLPAPAKLAEALRAFQKQRVFVPSQIDEKILAQAREHLRKQKRFVFLPRWAAMAASFILVSGLIYFLSPKQTQKFAAEDINRDGVVDILDAFVLARKVEAGEPRDADFNHDGAVNQQDAEKIASDVVRLNQGGRS